MLATGGLASAKPGVFHSVPEGTFVLQDCTYIYDSSRKANGKSGLERAEEVNVGHNRAQWNRHTAVIFDRLSACEKKWGSSRGHPLRFRL